jgi:hypothetical protein
MRHGAGESHGYVEVRAAPLSALAHLERPLIKRWEAVRAGQDFRNSRGGPFLDNGRKGITFLLRFRVFSPRKLKEKHHG